jgi:hypothetical protein
VIRHNGTSVHFLGDVSIGSSTNIPDECHPPTFLEDVVLGLPAVNSALGVGWRLLAHSGFTGKRVRPLSCCWTRLEFDTSSLTAELL